MPSSTIPTLTGCILLTLVALLSLATDRRTIEGRWFFLLNILLAATALCGALSTSADDADRSLVYGRIGNGTGTAAFVALYFQLGAMARGQANATLRWLDRFTPVVLIATTLGGVMCAGTPLVVSRVEYVPGIGYTTLLGPGAPIIFGMSIPIGTWALSMMFYLRKHGDRRRRRVVGWMAVMFIIDHFGLIVTALVLPKFGFTNGVAWAPTSLALGSMVMVGAMVLTRQHELDELESSRSHHRRLRPGSSPGKADPGTRSCATCGGMLAPRTQMAFCPLDGGEIVSNVDPWPGRTVDERFAIDELIGAGGMGRVYKAKHLKLGTPIAIKLLNADLAADGHTAERFAREARSAMRIRSPHVVIVHDLGELPPGIPFLTMEWIAGQSLNAVLRGERRLDAQSVARLGRDLAAGLAAAHAQGVIHRDLKPDNVLIVREGDTDVAKIVDFGLAKIIGDEMDSGEMTTVGKVFGTPAYLSPEQASGRTADSRSDVYALGALLYRARAGHPPFSGSLLELIAHHVNSVPPPLGEQPVDKLIMTLLAKDPALRPEAERLIVAFAALAGPEGHLFILDDKKLATDDTAPADPTKTLL